MEQQSPAETGRLRLPLDGLWEFRPEGQEPWRTIDVPGVWQAQFDDLRLSAGTGHYRRRFALPADWPKDRELALRFDAVSYLAEVTLNGHRLGTHEGGWLPFEYVLHPDELADDNLLEVRVTLPTSAPERPADQPSFAEIPHGKQSWYGPLAGIWQSVAVEARDAAHIRSCRIRADLATGDVHASISFVAPSARTALLARISDPDGTVVVEEIMDAEPGPDEARTIRLHVQEPRAWSPDAPDLYRLEVRLIGGGHVHDRWFGQFGFRTIETRDGRFFLNGQPLYLRGALDQDYYPDALMTLPFLELLAEQMRSAKAMGFNCLRCHIKVPDPRYYEVADRIGMLIWSEIPNTAYFTDAAARRLWATMEGILDRDYNHPSIIAWTIVNEDWGTDLDEDPDHRRWLLMAFDELKKRDPTRLIVDNSPCFPNFHVKTDIADFHYYRAIPDHRDEWDWLTEQFAGRASWIFAPDGESNGEEPLLLSEFGVWGLPHPRDLIDESGREPWWMETGEIFGDGVAYPHGVERRFNLIALDRVFGSFDRFIEATQRHQFQALKYQIESLRSYPSIQGYVITQLTDVYWEANGLMDMRRQPRSFHRALANLNRDLILLPRLDRYAFWAGQPLRLAPAIATGGEALAEGCSLSWAIEPGGISGQVAVSAAGACELVASAPIETFVPAVERAAMAELRLALHGPDRRELAHSTTDIAIYPQREPQDLPSIWTRDEDIAARFQALGYGVAQSAAAADLVVVRSVDSADVERIRLGRHHLLLADGPGGSGWLRSDHPVQGAVPTIPSPVNPPFPGIHRRVREGNVWRGDWITNFGWLARRGAFADFPGGPLLDLSFDRVAPRHVLWASVRPWEYEAGNMHAGVVVGWVHKPAAFIVERSIGAGRLVMSSFRLTRDAPGVDPVATNLVDALVKTTVTDR